MNDIDELARKVAAHADYRVLRRNPQPKEYTPEDGSKKARGLYVDVETTGMNAKGDRLIELGMVRFSYSRETGAIYRILDVLDQLEDPGRPIPAEIVALTGITDEMVRGRQIDNEAAIDLIKRSSLIIAHNADFDRKFMERRFPILAEKPWACSCWEVPWRAEGIRCAKLQCLANHYGFFFDGHRAANDCLAGLHILSQQLPISGLPVLKALLKNVGCKSHRLWAIGSPIETKGVLRARGYRWNPGDDGRPRSWYKDLAAGISVEEERHYLTSEIGCSEAKLRVDEFDAFSRYSERA